MSRRPSPALVISAFALFVALSGVGIAATGGNFILGQTNTADATSFLNGPVAGGATLQVVNTDAGAINGRSTNGRGIVGQHTGSTGTNPGIEAITSSTDAGAVALTATNSGGGPAAAFNVNNSGITPFKVNSSAKVTNLNADTVDGLDSLKLQPVLLAMNVPANTPPALIALVGALHVKAGCSVTGVPLMTVEVGTGFTGGLVHVTLTQGPASAPTIHYVETDSLATNTPFDVLGGATDDVAGTIIRYNGGTGADTIDFLVEAAGGRCKIGGLGQVSP